jgi:hypothetical protein
MIRSIDQRSIVCDYRQLGQAEAELMVAITCRMNHSNCGIITRTDSAVKIESGEKRRSQLWNYLVCVSPVTIDTVGRTSHELAEYLVGLNHPAHNRRL